jgi:hypothetical protein
LALVMLAPLAGALRLLEARSRKAAGKHFPNGK